jgi:ATP-binding cassette subfamily B protein
MTNQLVEHVAGHRTRLAQEHPQRWHTEEDRSLEDYTSRSSALDRWVPTLLITVPRGWLAIGFGVLAPSFVSGTSATSLAISLGGVLLAGLALRRFAEGLSQLSGAAIGWREASPLFHAAAARPLTPAISDHGRGPTGAAGGLEVRDLTFRYPAGSAPVLTGCSLSVRPGERILLEGRSGGGKSTLASIVAGLRAPTAGLVLVNGLDRRTLGGHAWRKRVVAAPQFHENHVFCETFAFNLLMGRRWPPTDADLEEAEVIARELGLGPLLDRMPAGLMQLVGEGGWQLSHGERGRLFMARALLQGGGVMILDETFAALDPETLQQTLECVLRRAPTLLVIAHP